MLNQRKSLHTDEFLLGGVLLSRALAGEYVGRRFTAHEEDGLQYRPNGRDRLECDGPEEGTYDFALFDRALEACGRHGLKVIMGTPTYAPPAWLTERYPEVLRVDFRGTVMQHGSRRHYNYTSPVYWRLCLGFVTALVEHMRSKRTVYDGWYCNKPCTGRSFNA